MSKQGFRPAQGINRVSLNHNDERLVIEDFFETDDANLIEQLEAVPGLERASKNAPKAEEKPKDKQPEGDK